MTSAQQKRPRRQRKGDRLVSPDASAVEIRIDHSLAPLDGLARKMDRKWGVERLPELVSPETAARYGSAIAKLNAAIADNDADEVLRRAQVCMRGLAAMNIEAEERGEQPARGDVWEYELDGFRFGILADGAEWPAAQDERPDLRLFTLREIAVALRTIAAHHPMIERAKKIGGAEIVSIEPKLDNAFWKEGGDDIPF